MKLDQFVNKMVPFLRRNELLEDLDTSVKIIRDVSLPLFERAKFLDNHKWKDRQNQEFQTFWNKADRENKGNWVPGVRKALEQLLKNAEVVSKLISSRMSDETYKDAMSYLKANLTQYVAHISFFVKYANLQLNNACALEAAAFDKNADIEDLAPATRRWLMENRGAFASVYRIMVIRDSELSREMQKVPDAIIEPEAFGHQTDMLGRAKTDPLRMGFIPVVLNPFLWVQIKIADWVHDRYEAAREEKTTVELRLAELHALSSGNQADENIRRQIKYRQDQLTKLDRRIRDYEEQVDG